MKPWLLLLTLIVTSGCASTRKYERVLDSWAGSDISNLIERWGPPSETYTMPDGRHLYTWYFNEGVVAMPAGNMAYAVQRYCKTTFTVGRAGVVERWSYQGNACRA